MKTIINQLITYLENNKNDDIQVIKTVEDYHNHKMGQFVITTIERLKQIRDTYESSSNHKKILMCEEVELYYTIFYGE